MEDQIFNAQISHSIETMQIDHEMDLSTISMEAGEIMETFLTPHRLKEENFHKVVHIAIQEVINLTILLSADLRLNLRPVFRLTNKNFHKTITKRHLIWIVSLQPTMPLTSYQTFVR